MEFQYYIYDYSVDLKMKGLESEMKTSTIFTFMTILYLLFCCGFLSSVLEIIKSYFTFKKKTIFTSVDISVNKFHGETRKDIGELCFTERT